MTNAATVITIFPIAGLVIVMLTEPKQLLVRTRLVHVTKTATVFARNWSREKSAHLVDLALLLSPPNTLMVVSVAFALDGARNATNQTITYGAN